MEMPSKKQMYLGVFWNATDVFIKYGFQFVVKLILARLLLPEHFGLVGMAVVFTGLIKVISEMGLSAGLIQKKDSELEPIYYDTIFWGSLIFKVVLFLLVILFIAPATVWFYDEEALYSIVVTLSIPLLFSPFNIIHRVILSRELNFKAIAKVEIISSIIGGFSAIVMAILGFGVWSIIFNGIISSFLTTFLMWSVTKWIPKLRFSLIVLKDILAYSIYILLNSVLRYFSSNIDYLLIGRLLGAELLGVYTIAFMLTDMLRGRIFSVLNKVLFPVFSKMQHDLKLIHDYYLETIKYNAIICFPIYTIFIIQADLIILVGFGDSWIGAINPLRILSIASLVFILVGTPHEVMKAIGKPDISFKISLYNTIFIVFPSLILGIIFLGINGAALGVLLYTITSRLAYQFYMWRMVNIEIKEVFKAIIPALCGSTSIFILSIIIRQFYFKYDFLFLSALILILSVGYLVVLTPFLLRDENLNKLLKRKNYKKSRFFHKK